MIRRTPRRSTRWSADAPPNRSPSSCARRLDLHQRPARRDATGSRVGMNRFTIVHPFNIPIHIGGLRLELSGFGIAVLLAFAIAQVISERELLRRGYVLEARHVGDVLLAAILGTLVGGKLYFVAVITHNWHDLLSRAGFVFWGGFIGAVVACWATIHFRKLPFARYADVAGIAIA